MDPSALVKRKLDTVTVGSKTVIATKITLGQLLGGCETGNLKWIQEQVAAGNLTEQILFADSYAALRMACTYGQLDVAKLLFMWYKSMRQGRYVPRSCFYRALCSACCNGNLLIAQWLQKSAELTPEEICAIDEPLMFAVCSTGHLPVARWIHEIAPNIVRHSNAALLLQRACGSGGIIGGVEFVEWLVDTFKMTPEDVSTNEDAALHIAQDYQHEAIVKWLKDKFYADASTLTLDSMPAPTPTPVSMSAPAPTPTPAQKRFEPQPSRRFAEEHPEVCQIAKVPTVWEFPEGVAAKALYAGEKPSSVVFEGRTFCYFGFDNPLRAIEAHLAGKPEFRDVKSVRVPYVTFEQVSGEKYELLSMLGVQYIEWMPDGPNSDRRVYAVANKFDQAREAWETNSHNELVEIPIMADFRVRYAGRPPPAVELLVPYFRVKYVEQYGPFYAELR